MQCDFMRRSFSIRMHKIADNTAEQALFQDRHEEVRWIFTRRVKRRIDSNPPRTHTISNMRRHPNKTKVAPPQADPFEYLFQFSEVIRKIFTGELKSVMQLHSGVCIFVGLGTLLLPHRYYSSTTGYNHFAHEFVRLYGCLTLGIGYLVWVTKDIKDGRLLRALTETFALSYGLQSLAMLRAQFASPDGHSFFHWLIIILFTGVSGLYSYCRFFRKMKDFELPGFGRDDWNWNWFDPEKTKTKTEQSAPPL